MITIALGLKFSDLFIPLKYLRSVLGGIALLLSQPSTQIRGIGGSLAFLSPELLFAISSITSSSLWFSLPGQQGPCGHGPGAAWVWPSGRAGTGSAARRWGDCVGEDPPCNLITHPLFRAKRSLHRSARDEQSVLGWIMQVSAIVLTRAVRNCFQKAVPNAALGGHTV